MSPPPDFRLPCSCFCSSAIHGIKNEDESKFRSKYLKWRHTHAIGINQWVYIYIKSTPMVRQSISLTTPNDEWLKSQVDKEEYSSKSELVNDLIRQARRQQAKVDWLKTKLEKAEQGGFTTDSKEQILQQAKSASNG